METTFLILISTLMVSLVSLVGLATLSAKKKLIRSVIFVLVSLAAGTLLGAAFFDIMPEVFEELGTVSLNYILIGILLFFGIEKYIHWHHCHKGDCNIKTMGYINLIGDGLHNLVDGALIAASYMQSHQLGLITTFAVIIHEIPQELGDFAVLLHSGFSPQKALFFNFISALLAVFGSILAIFFLGFFERAEPIVLSIAAGGFVYLALVDIVPEMHKEQKTKLVAIQGLTLLFGLILMFLFGKIIGI